MKPSNLVLGMLLWFSPCVGLCATMPAIQMKVVDEATGEAVADAHVLFQARAHEGTWTGHGGKVARLFVTETTTDPMGSFHLPQQKFSAHPFFLNTNYENPSLVILKEGYELLILYNNLRIIPKLDEVTVWEYNNQTVKMKRAKPGADLSQTIRFAAQFAELMNAQKTFCDWKNFPAFLVALDHWDAKVNRTKPELNHPSMGLWGMTSPLQKILKNEAFYIEKGCGSPQAFFEPYLR